jgi:type IV fimbrial biogenesis protein FimT
MPAAMNQTHGRPRNDAGFTAIELIVVLTLMAIVTSLAAPAMGAYTNRHKTQRALDRLTGDIAMARMLAVRSGNRAVVHVNSANSYRIWVEGTPADTVRRVSLANDYTGVALQAPTADGRLVFNSRGLLLTPGTGVLTAQLGTARDTIRITAAGRVYRAY